MNPSASERAKALLAEAATLPAADRERFVIDLASRSRDFDLHPDGSRLALATAGPAGPPIRRYPILIVLNFFDELRRIASVQKH